MYDVEGAARWISTRVSKKYHSLEYDEILSEATKIILEHIERFDPEKGTFSTYVDRYCYRTLFRWAKKQVTNSATDIDYEPIHETLPEASLILKETIHNLPQISQNMLKILFESPSEILLACSGHPSRVRGYLVKEVQKRHGYTKPWIYKRGMEPLRRAFK